jgi:hypothetical protein
MRLAIVYTVLFYSKINQLSVTNIGTGTSVQYGTRYRTGTYVRYICIRNFLQIVKKKDVLKLKSTQLYNSTVWFVLRIVNYKFSNRYRTSTENYFRQLNTEYRYGTIRKYRTGTNNYG